MKVKFLSVVASAALAVSGCASQVESTPDMYQDVEVLSAAPSMLPIAEPVRVGSVISQGVLLESSVRAINKGDMVEILKTYARVDAKNLPVSSSRYLYKFNGAFMELVSHDAEQRGMVGAWPIPRLEQEDIKRLVTIKTSSDISLYHLNNASVKGRDGYVYLLPKDGGVEIKVGTDQRCDEIGYSGLGTFHTTFAIDGAEGEYGGLAECDLYTGRLTYTLPQEFNAVLRKLDGQLRSYADLTVDKVEYGIPALGFAKAEAAVISAR